MEMEIELSDLTKDAVRRLLKEAVRAQARNSKPVGRRGKDKDDECEEDEYEKTAAEDNAAKVDMSRRGVKSSLPTVTADDLPRGVKFEQYKSKSKKAKGYGKK